MYNNNINPAEFSAVNIVWRLLSYYSTLYEFGQKYFHNMNSTNNVIDTSRIFK